MVVHNYDFASVELLVWYFLTKFPFGTYIYIYIIPILRVDARFRMSRFENASENTII